MIPIPERTFPDKALALLSRTLDGCGALWVVGGSTGLAMRGADLGRPPRDVDLYADEEDAARIHADLADYAVDEPEESVTGIYRSILSHYRIGDAAVELVGHFRIDTGSSRYSTEVREALHPLGETRTAGGRPVRLAPLGHELIFNVLRGRPDRCRAAGALIRLEPDRHLPALRRLLALSELSKEDADSVFRYAGESE
ncbi:hypothetical protein [Cohnella caldifontis]|uniref:hypothetical protein n=1 Tax=Cohnella caldifontis TaxID=3027471 RepID=UPI0023EAE8FC|nr:hypothetical protein [Cohnella sp. YIM B05605]